MSKTIFFENLSDEEYQNLTEEELARVIYPSDLFFNSDVSHRVSELKENEKAGNLQGTVIAKGDKRFEGFDN